jgi:hypothetical protein
MAVMPHDVPKDWVFTDLYQRLGLELGFLAQARTLPAA